MKSFYPKENSNCIYTTGAFLTPLKVTDDEGNPQWLWAVTSFDDSTYLDGECCHPVESAETVEKLFWTDDDDEVEDEDEVEDDDNNN